MMDEEATQTYLQPILNAFKETFIAVGLAPLRAKDFDDTTMFVAFVPSYRFGELPGLQHISLPTGQACIFRTGRKPSSPVGQIDDAVIGIGVGEGRSRDQLSHCILEEIAQAAGLANDACHYRPSLFCEGELVTAMTPADRVLLRTLYDPRLRPGMTRAEAMPIAREIIRELWRE